MNIFGFGKRKEPEIEIIDSEDEFDDDDEEYEEPDREAMLEQVYEWARDWAKTPGFEALSEDDKLESENILTHFTSYMFDYHDEMPDQWDAQEMQECCLQTLPRKVSAEESYFRAMAPVLDSFFTFLSAARLQQNGIAMAKRVRGLDKKIIAASNNPRYWGPAKQFAMAAIKKGVDLSDDKQMNAFMEGYNAEILAGLDSRTDPLLVEEWDDEDYSVETPFVREGPKVGRNDPCPCGSGKKYKKCCGGA